MVSLFLTSLAIASDVYEICSHTKQVWIEAKQDYETEFVGSFYTTPTIQLIFHENSFEINRRVKNVESRYTRGEMVCWREHENSEICYNFSEKTFYWEYFYKNGKVTRDIMGACVLNGKSI